MTELSTIQAKKVASFRALHKREGAFLIVNPWDVGSAKILEGLGFEALASTSGGFAWSMGRQDGGDSREQKLEHCRMLVSNTTLPISADLGIGYGESPKSVAECVRLAAATGLAGCSIEDASVKNGQQFEFNLALERISAAVDAIRSLDHDFVLTARCESFVYGGGDIEQTIRRLQAYSEAGADVLYAPGITDLEMISVLCRSLTKPVNVLTGFRGMQASFDELEEAGAKRISVGTQLARIAYGALVRSAKELKSTLAINETDIDVRSSAIAEHFDAR